MKYYYINLKHRSDRNIHMENELDGFDYIRVDAIYNKEYPYLGSVLSHIKTINIFLESGDDMCVIMEDDFTFTRDKNQLLTDIGVEWDLIMLSGNVIKSIPYNQYVDRVVDVQTSSGYIITKEFAKKLKTNYIEGYYKLQTSYEPSKYAIDIYWKRLQPTSNWFIFNPRFGKQMASYSDNEQKFTDYNV